MKYNVGLTFQYGLIIFLSAFLLFQVQPLMGKLILPWFGGSASVWTTCMLFFQATLLFGYVYSHWIVKALSPYKQSILHIALLVLSLFLLPIAPSEIWKPSGDENPTTQILGLLFVSIGLPYFVLSTTGPLVQAWFAREKTAGVPYRLFALSNLGSMIALLAYPTLFEPLLPTRWQSYSWSALFFFFVLACGTLAWQKRHGQPLAHADDTNEPPPSARSLTTWILLATCPSILMVADTSYLTENIAPVPMIWVAPLTLYLLSFILCFESKGWYQRKIYLPLLIVSLFVLSYLPTMEVHALPTFVEMAINFACFFVICMACHGELAQQQPHPKFLTTYYLMLALGGVAGGFFVGVIAPYFFNGNYELSIGIVLAGTIIAIVFFADQRFDRTSRKVIAVGGAVCFLALIGFIRVNDHLFELRGSKLSLRNFYGTLKVIENAEGGYINLMHGQISHGRQYTDPNRRLEPTSYYVRESGVGKVITIGQAGAKSIKVGVIGLGIGTLAAYARPDDAFRFYEINPQVIEVARERFDFLSSASLKSDLILGDARLRLEHEPPQKFDVLVIDAFSGDSVPVHLLTLEAFAQYFKHLKPDGVLALHVTNRFLDLEPVVWTAAEHFAAEVRMVRMEVAPGQAGFRSHWAVMTRNKAYFDNALLKDAKRMEAPKNFLPWKDDYSSLISILY